jgi:hypothetical protein
MNFSFENLNVYKKAVAWASTVETLVKDLRSRVSHPLLDQPTRAALSAYEYIWNRISGKMPCGDKNGFRAAA